VPETVLSNQAIRCFGTDGFFAHGLDAGLVWEWGLSRFPLRPACCGISGLFRKLCFMRYLFALLLLISGCASQTRLAVDNLDERHPVRSSEVCQHATQLASLHDDIKLSRTLGSPAIVVAVGSVAFVPVWLLNMGLDALDRMDASHVNVSCGYDATPAQNIAEQVFLGGGFNLFTSGIKPGGN
jgi:hypothetical protein